jgi:hypothetical protein
MGLHDRVTSNSACGRRATPTTHVQCIVVRWTKLSRGGSAATARNAVPLGFSWPDTSNSWHCVNAWEWVDDFAPFMATDVELPRSAELDLGIRHEPDSVSVQPSVSPYWMPKRHRRPPRMRLHAGDSVRWILNYRLGLDHGWTYGQVTFNVAYMASDIATLFSTEPARVVDERGSLR